MNEGSVRYGRFLLFLLAAAWLLYQALSKKSCPPGHTFDWEKSSEELRNGLDAKEWNHRVDSGHYWSGKAEIKERKEKNKPVEVLPKVVDIERYEKDKQLFGLEWAEMNREAGEYMTIRKFT